jgi:hypothetical protein
MRRLLFLLAAFAFGALAADITGTWKGTAEGPNGNLERTFVFQVDGSKVTGETTSTMMGKSVLMDGKMDGDNLSFSITAKLQDNEVKLSYKGKVIGDEIHLTSEIAGGAGGGVKLEWTARKVK